VSLLGARNDLPNPYQPGVHWGTLPDGRVWGSVVGIDIAPDGTIWAAERCGVWGTGGQPCLDHQVDPIVQFDQSGRFLRSFGRGTVVSPHKLDVDREGNIWVTDMGTAPGIGQQVLKFNPQGQIVLRLGTAGESGSGPDHFQQPTDVAVAPNGDIYVADGHSTAITGNARIVKFDRTGKFIKDWGKKGMGPGEFDLPHELDIDSQGRVFVADRQNNRIQVFDADGNFVAVWYQFGRPSAFFIDRDDTIYVSDSESRDGRTNTGRPGLPSSGYGYNLGARRGIRIGSAKDGTVQYFVPDPCPYPYPAVSSMTEGIAVDAAKNIYGSEWLGTVRKYIRE
jgi:DNA-binding beta-propeller fold protein YncE